MNRLIIWLFVSLFALLLNRFSQLDAHPSQICSRDRLSLERCNHSGHAGFSITQEVSAAASAGHVISPHGEAIPKIDVAEVVEGEEEEEHEPCSVRKPYKYNHYATSILIAQRLGRLFGYTKKSLPFCKHFSYRSPYQWFLIFRVIRI